MKANIKAALLKLVLGIGQAATILAGILLMQLLVLASGVIPGLDLVALFGDQVPYYADLIGVAAGYGLLQSLKQVEWLKPIFG